MKIIQLMARIEGSGVTRYVIEINKGLKLAGHDVEIIYVKSEEKAQMRNKTQDISDITEYDYSEETVKHLNEADLVIVNSIMAKKCEEKYHDLWMDLVMHKITTRKAIVCNDHNVAGFNAYYGPLLKNSEFWLSFDKIITFAKTAKVAEKIKLACGSDAEFNKRFVHLLLPYDYNDETKKKWIPADKKYRRITYLGRHSSFKDPDRLLRGREKFYAHNYELEMRGIKPTINVASIPDFIYSFDENGKRLDSKTCIVVDHCAWRRKNGVDMKDNMMDYPRQKGWCYVFAEYKRDEGLDIVSRSAFGCDFFHLKDDGCYGDDFEYSIFEMIDMGSIPLLDWNAGNACRMYDITATPTDKTALELGLGIFIKKDLTNLDECLEQMDELMKDPKKYDELRNRIFDTFKINCDPKAIATKLVKDCMADKPAKSKKLLF